MSKIQRVPFEDIFYFKEVSRLESISKTAELYQLTKDALIHRLDKINKFSDQIMFDRTGDVIYLTERGRRFFRENEVDVLSYYNITCDILDHNKGSGLKNISILIPLEFANALTPMIENYLNENKDVNITIDHNDRVSLENIFAYDVICHQSLDALIKLDSFYIYKVLALPRVLCAAPEYLKKYGQPKDIDELASDKHQFIDNIIDKGHISLISPDQKEVAIRYNSIISVNNLRTYFSYLFEGKGIGAPSSAFVFDLMEKGRLVRVLPEYTPQTMNYFLMLSDIKPMPKYIEEFANYMLQIHKEYKFIDC